MSKQTQSLTEVIVSFKVQTKFERLNRAGSFCSGLLKKEAQQSERIRSDGNTHVSVYKQLNLPIRRRNEHQLLCLFICVGLV